MNVDPGWERLQAKAREIARKTLPRARSLFDGSDDEQLARETADDILAEARGYFFQRLRDMTANLPR